MHIFISKLFKIYSRHDAMHNVHMNQCVWLTKLFFMRWKSLPDDHKHVKWDSWIIRWRGQVGDIDNPNSLISNKITQEF